MRAIACVLVSACLCLPGAGCSLFKKNPSGAAGSAGGPAPAKFPGTDPLLDSKNIGQPPPTYPTPPLKQTSAVRGDSMLAGTVIDAYHRPISNAYVRWVNLDEKDAGAPIDVSTDSGGHFVIMGVRQGGAYRLIARTKQGEKMLAGAVLTNAPNVRVLIPIREDLVNANTPPLPSTPAQENKTPKNSEGGPQEGAWSTDGGARRNKLVEPPSVPTTMIVPVAPAATTTRNDASATLKNPSVADSANPPRLPMLTLPTAVPAKPPTLPAWTPPQTKLNTGPTRVPSCVLIGQHLENMALKDSRGKTWEYKKHAAGKLVLIEFWRTNCIPCRDSMPDLERLHRRYAARGLEVVGIALEAGKDERREADAVNRMCAAMHVTYRQLMGRTGAFDLGTQFRVKGVPMMFLLDQQGDIIYDCTGRPDPKLLESLERSIQARLSPPPS